MTAFFAVTALFVDARSPEASYLVWAQDLSVSVRRASRTMPRTGYGSIKGQMIRAAESIVFTIVEGCGASTNREFARFLEMAIKSSMELEAELELANKYGALERTLWQTLTRDTVSLRKMTCVLRSKLLGGEDQ